MIDLREHAAEIAEIANRSCKSESIVHDFDITKHDVDKVLDAIDILVKEREP